MDQAEFRSVPGLAGVELYRAHITQRAFEPHTHQAYGLGMIEAGVERFRYGGTDHLAAPQSIVTMHPDMLHTGRAETSDGWRYRMLYVDPVLVDELSGEAHWSFDDVVTSRHPGLAQRIALLHRRLWQCDDRLEADGLLLEFMSALRPLARTGAGPARDGGAARLDPVLDYMRATLRERILLADLAAVVQLSPFHFLRKFKAQYHVTPHQMLMALRLFAAKQMLALRLPPAEVAAAAGLTDQAHLTRAFARRYGVTPSRYQRQVS
ncbi:AraC family transcriptional regulator [Variovorax ginsengisoli]|uniref:AraC-like DNA-binding protein n=1 Tax=Variovorax ginsengisoli TaxID=363844 RepID=A0ABT9S3C4_9BURK|nr:AraC family transcriptional regulator [Variovorax ginsengisoli]MDP9898840.1 AraC-like DNA-binding protein [Variovorax ginsengisoli]